ncbi:hypothetical protein C2E23DRAFT_832405 [Lenzites betulinus]|nr:hypothetical protein C2E23DRAFT_832405 [Lenzites betulinus]
MSLNTSLLRSLDSRPPPYWQSSVFSASRTLIIPALLAHGRKSAPARRSQRSASTMLSRQS